MDQAKRASQETGTDPAATARTGSHYVSVPIAERRRSPMILPRDISGVAVAGTHDLKGVSTRDLSILFRMATEPFQTPVTTWYLGGGAGIETLFLEWMSNRCAGYIHVVLPNTLDETPEKFREAFKAARFNLGSGVSLTEMNLQEQSPEPLFASRRWMVDQSQVLLAFPHESTPGLPTQYTISYATSLGLPRTIWPVGK